MCSSDLEDPIAGAVTRVFDPSIRAHLEWSDNSECALVAAVALSESTAFAALAAHQVVVAVVAVALVHAETPPVGNCVTTRGRGAVVRRNRS